VVGASGGEFRNNIGRRSGHLLYNPSPHRG
jgi:hypothetical protein